MRISPTWSRPGGSGWSFTSPTRICTPQIGLPMDRGPRSSARLKEQGLPGAGAVIVHWEGGKPGALRFAGSAAGVDEHRRVVSVARVNAPAGLGGDRVADQLADRAGALRQRRLA